MSLLESVRQVTGTRIVLIKKEGPGMGRQASRGYNKLAGLIYWNLGEWDTFLVLSRPMRAVQILEG